MNESQKSETICWVDEIWVWIPLSLWLRWSSVHGCATLPNSYSSSKDLKSTVLRKMASYHVEGSKEPVLPTLTAQGSLSQSPNQHPAQWRLVSDRVRWSPKEGGREIPPNMASNQTTSQFTHTVRKNQPKTEVSALDVYELSRPDSWLWLHFVLT